MNSTILEPLNRLHLPGGLKVLALHINADKVYLGLTNGDLRIMRVVAETERESMRPEARSVKSFRSFSEVRRLFHDNEISQVLSTEKTFHNVLQNHTPITAIGTLPLYGDCSREVLLLGTADTLQVYEWVGPHLDLVRTFSEIRTYSQYAFAEVAIGTEELESDFDAERRASKTENGAPKERAHTSKYLLVSSRKKLLVFDILHRSRNIFDFVLKKELLMRERIRDIRVLAGQAKALIATVQNLLCLHIIGDFQTTDVIVDTSNTHSFAQTSSFLYFGLAGAGPQVFIVPVSDTLSLFVRDTEVGMVNVQANTVVLKDLEIKLAATPVNVAFLLPCYVVFVYQKTFDVVDLYSGNVVQTFKHGLGYATNVFALDSALATLSAGPDIYQFKVLSVQKQLDLFLAMRGPGLPVKGKRDPRNDLRLVGIQRAIVLISSLDDSHSFFEKGDSEASGTKQKQLFLRDLNKDKVLILCDSYLMFHEALAVLASEWIVPFQEVLQLFPDFLNGILQITPKKTGQASSKTTNPVRNVTLSEIESFNDNTDRTALSSDSDTKGEIGDHAFSSTTQHIRNFHRAVQNLIVFLTEQRRVHLSFLNSPESDPAIPWKNVLLRVSDLYPGIDVQIVATKLTEYASAIDTSLFLCYYYTKPMMLGPLLRLPHNRCNARVVNDCLLNSTHLEPHEQLNFISQLLDFYFGRGLHDEALRLLNNFASESLVVKNGNLNPSLANPILSVRYMQRLSNEHLDLIFKYSHWVLTEHPEAAAENARLLFMNDSFECESYDSFRVLDHLSGIIKSHDLAITYLEWLLYESGVFDDVQRKRDLPKLSTRLCLLYLKKMKTLGSKEKFYQSRSYTKLEKLLGSAIEYEPWTILKSIPPSDEKYFRLTVYIYYRLGEHQTSVDILYNQLGDLDEAMRYCAKVHDEPNGEEKGQKLLFKLLEDLLMHYNENQDAIARFLTLQGQKLPTLQLLTALPDSFPLHKLDDFLQKTANHVEEKQFVTSMKGQLFKISASKAHYELIMTQSCHYAISDPDQSCPICTKPLSHSATCVNTADQIVHYGCVDKEERNSLSSCNLDDFECARRG